MSLLSEITEGHLDAGTKPMESLATDGFLTFGQVVEAVREVLRTLLRPVLRDVQKLPPP